MRRIFIVPYRNREDDRAALLSRLLPEFNKNHDDIWFLHQRDNRPFNRGAMKNIGFLAVKRTYPATYKTMTIVFHDVDVFPKEGTVLPYETTEGVVAHYYGYRFALGGIFAIKGGDFERANGFPSFWGWGLEDNVIQERCLEAGLTIDRANFYSIGDTRIHHAFDGYKRHVSRPDANAYFVNRAKQNGLASLKNVRFIFERDMVHVDGFDTGTQYTPKDFFVKDVRHGNKLVIPRPKRMSMAAVIGSSK